MNYTQQMELMNDEYFNFANNRLHWFRKCEEDDNPLDGSVIDKYLLDRRGEPCCVELKIRDCDINTFNGVFIEEKKFNQMREDFYNGIIPLYINFFRDKYHFCMWDMRRYFKGKEPEKVECTINNYGYGSVDHVYRYKLPQYHGHYFVYYPNSDRYVKEW